MDLRAHPQVVLLDVADYLLLTAEVEVETVEILYEFRGDCQHPRVTAPRKHLHNFLEDQLSLVAGGGRGNQVLFLRLAQTRRAHDALLDFIPGELSELGIWVHLLQLSGGEVELSHVQSKGIKKFLSMGIHTTSFEAGDMS
jgi:hypothetical protein